jgi:hypothetical protein
VLTSLLVPQPLYGPGREIAMALNRFRRATGRAVRDAFPLTASVPGPGPGTRSDSPYDEASE